MTAGHGPNLGHGYVKYVLIDHDGTELPPIIFPALIAPAGRAVVGALDRVPTSLVGLQRYWTGEDALLAPAPLSLLAQERLFDPIFIPALLRGALDRFGSLNGAGGGVCVTGLPATWAADHEKARLLGERLRAAHPAFSEIRVIPEPLGLVYSVLLDRDGQLVGDAALIAGRIGVVDLGHLTVDLAVIQRLAPIPTALDTYQLGTVMPLGQIRARLSAHFARELTLHETDQAVRVGRLRIAGRERALPPQWDRPLIEHGQALAARLIEAWGSGAQLDAILLGGGGAALAPLVSAIQRHFPHAQVIAEPQLAIARGYARLARRLGRAL
jgi:hypothetical protein